MKGESFPSQNGLILRAATEDDLDAITRIHREGFVGEPAVNYMYPSRDRYPNDFREWTRKEYAHYLKQSKKWLLQVIDAPVETDGQIAMKPAGLAVWDIAIATKDDDAGILEPFWCVNLDGG